MALEKSRRVLDLEQNEDDGMVMFSNLGEGGMEVGCETQVWLPQQDWDDFGQPERITLTIEPGDLLN